MVNEPSMFESLKFFCSLKSGCLCGSHTAHNKVLIHIHACTCTSFFTSVVSTIGQSGEWSKWSQWSQCSVSCGYGIQKREKAWQSANPRGSNSDPFTYSDIMECFTNIPCPSMYFNYLHILVRKPQKVNNADPDQTPPNAASVQGLHCLHSVQEFI